MTQIAKNESLSQTSPSEQKEKAEQTEHGERSIQSPDTASLCENRRQFVLRFSEEAAQQVSLSGGKGANLSKLTALGFNVPMGLVVSANAYRAFIAQADWLPEEIKGWRFEEPEALLGQTLAAQARLRELPLPPGLLEELNATAAELPPRISVRSSATSEDTASAAFAGQHDTYLNVAPESVAERLKECWVSLWSDRAVAYRRQVGVGVLDTSMAVVLQSMVQAESAGVAFSVDPIAGLLDRVLVDANHGLGESVVSGMAEVDHYVLDKATGEAIERAIAKKSLQIVSLPDGGTEEIHLGEADSARSVLSPEQLAELAKLARDIEKAYGFPQDIEWAWMDGTFHALQSRPITSIAPRWTREESAERFPNPVTPLAWDLSEKGFHLSLNHSFELMGLPPFAGKWFAIFDGYVYGNQNAVEMYANGVPISLQSPADLVRMLPILSQKYGWAQELPTRWSRDLDWYLLRLGKLSATPLGELSLKGLWAHVMEISETGSTYFLPNIAISITQRVLYKVLHSMLAMIAGPAEAPAMFDALLAHCDTKTGVINEELYRLAQAVKARPDIFETFENGAEILAHWRQGSSRDAAAACPEFAARFEKLLEDHGHRETEFDPYMPTWAEAPEVVMDTLRVMSRGELRDPQGNAQELKRKMQETLFALQQKAPAELRYFFTEVARLAQTYTSLDDLEHYQTTRLTLPTRRALRELGRRLMDLGIVAEPMDVFFARQETLDRAVMSPTPEGWTMLAQEIKANKALHQDAKTRDPRWALAEEGDGAAAEAPDGGWKGIPGSPGVVTAPVFLVHGTQDFGKFPQGAILVARTTNPAWTPLFYSAAGVITESGGPLSHGAVTAREMRKPAVMGIQGMLGQLKNGDWVSIDGSRGTIARAEAPAASE